MTDIHILKSIVENLSEQKSLTTVNNYKVLLLTVLINIATSFI